MTKIAIERETLERAISALSDGGPPTQLITALRAALAAQPADAQEADIGALEAYEAVTGRKSIVLEYLRATDIGYAAKRSAEEAKAHLRAALAAPTVNRYCRVGMCVETDKQHEPGCVAHKQPADPNKPTVQRLMDLARRFRSAPGDQYDGAYKALQDACYEALAQPAEPVEPVQETSTAALITECRDALAEELSAWDIDPPLHHVKQAHDRCVAWLAAQPGYVLVPIEPTPEMCRAGHLAEISASTHLTQPLVYRAMIAVGAKP